MIRNVEESDDGTYTCRAVVIQTGELAERNIKLEVSRNILTHIKIRPNMTRNVHNGIFLQVYTAPEMEEREPRVEIREGESAAISCKARGKPNPTYSWVRASTREVCE